VAFFVSSLDAGSGSSRSDTKALRMKWNKPAPIPLNQIQVAVDTAYERCPPSQTSLNADARQGDKRHELSVGSDLDCAIETLSDLQIPPAAATARHSRLL
jgi:hypothetical protein